MDAMRVGVGCRGAWLAGSMRAGRSRALFAAQDGKRGLDIAAAHVRF